MHPIEADYDDGVLRLTKPLHLKQGERVSVVVLRRPDPARWDLGRLARIAEEDRALAEDGLNKWASDLDGDEKPH